MFVSECLNINNNGNLTIGGVDTTELVKEFGTPLYVLDEQTIRDNCRKFKSSLEKNYKNSLVIFASKALNCLEMCRVINSEGLGLDVVSGGELYTALKAGFPAERIFFHGNNKTYDELEMAIEEGIGRIIVDNPVEMATINEIAEKFNKTVSVLFRIKPGVDAHTHDFVKTGQIDSKFGFAIENGEAYEIINQSKNYKNINLVGLHCHIGSQIFDDEPFIETAEIMISFYAKIKNELGISLSELNLGGGFGIKYLESDNHLPYEEFMDKVADKIHNLCNDLSIDEPKILIEPGRSIVGAAGITLYKIGSVKEIEGIRNYVAVDGGLSDNPRYALYKSDYTVVVANKADIHPDYKATIAGKCCESGDLIQEDVLIAKPCVGDILAVLSTGAYNFSMASNYNRIRKPAMVMITDGKPRLIVKRETYDDIIKNDL